jgi:hypothetical protein
MSDLGGEYVGGRPFSLLLVRSMKFGCELDNPSRIAWLIEKEKIPAVFPIFHNQGAFTHTEFISKMQN